ncbi:iron ABC transporter permease [bacterium]|nr:iron ABC transporter permease [bacterium]
MKHIQLKKEILLGFVGVLLLLWFLVGNILYPALKTFQLSLTEQGSFSLIHYINILTKDTSVTVIKNSIGIGLLTVIVCGLVGTTLAFFVHYFDFPFKSTIDKLLLLPIMLPGIIIVFSFVQLYGESGLITKSLEWIFGLEETPYHFSGLTGILFVHAYTQYVYFYISVSIAIKHIDYSTIECARNLGASKSKIFTSVLFPFLAPALIASSVMTFMSGIGSFTAPSIIGGRYKVLTTQILLSKANNFMHVAATQVVILVCISLFFFAILSVYEKKAFFIPSVNRVPIEPVKIEKRVPKIFMAMIGSLLILLVLLPVFTIILLSFVKSGSWMVNVFPQEFTLENYIDIATRSRTFSPFLDSVYMSLLAAVLSVVIAVPSSYIIVKTKSKMKWIIGTLVMLPWTMPASAIAINLINAYNEPNFFSFNAVLVGTYLLLPLGYFIKTIPIFVKTTNLSFQNLNESYLEASKSLGASQMQTFQRITLSIISPGVLAGVLLVFVRSIGEYNLSAFLYTPTNRPISIAMVNAIFEYNIGLAMAYGTLLITLTAVLSLFISKLSGKGSKP